MIMLCSDCRSQGDITNGRAQQCEGHEYLPIPSDEWHDLAVGKVNWEGQEFEEWLQTLQERYPVTN